MTKKKGLLTSLRLEITPLEENSEGQLRGGFGIFGPNDGVSLQKNGNCGDNCNCWPEEDNDNCGRNCNCETPDRPTTTTKATNNGDGTGTNWNGVSVSMLF